MAVQSRTDPTPLIPYIRQSRAKERTISIDEQLRSIREWADREGVELADPVIERGVSGSKPWRDRELGKAVAECEAGKAAGIIVAYQDRLSRENGLGTAEVWQSLEKAGARLVASAEGLDTAAGDQEMLFAIKAAVAREQWKRYKLNWDGAKRSAVARGAHPVAHVPIGYVDGGGRHLVPDPQTADAVRSLFRLRAQGASWSELCTHLEGLGVKPGRAEHWAIHSVRKIVMSRVYLGEAWMGEFVNPTAHEPLVTHGVWTAAQVKHEGRTARGTEGARLSGLVRCASCGGRLTPELPAWDYTVGPGRNDGGKPIGPGRYRCKPRMSASNQLCTAPASAKMHDLDVLVIEDFVARYERYLGEMTDEREPVEAEPLRRKLAHARDALDVLLGDPASLAALSHEKRTELLQNAQAAVDVAQTELDDVEATQATGVVNVWGLGDYFESDGIWEARIPEQRRLLTAGIERIVVQRGSEPIGQRVEIVWKEQP